MFCECRRCLNCITPPHILEKLLESKDKDIRQAALSTLLTTARLRGERAIRGAVAFAAAGPGGGRRTIFDCRNGSFLPNAVLARTEDGAPAADESVNRAFDGLGTTRDFYREVLERDSIDGHGMRLDGYVHRGVQYNNAFWDGREMVFGDGDGVVFTDFTSSLDVIAHELTHGVTEFTAGLEYHFQSGALNESISDVFGSLVKQWSLGQSADAADWLIGAEVFTPGIGADALRSLKAPGTAYDNSLLGRDPQPDHMSKFEVRPDTEAGDWGGVHINSGIPNKAFYLTAVGIGGNAWEAPGHIWYEALRASGADTQFQEFADTTYAKAGELYGTDSAEQRAVSAAWREVGIRISGAASGGSRGRGGAASGDTLADLTKQVAALAGQVKALVKDVGALKTKR
ncbi:Protease PrtS precursor [Gemmata obscuriglobus]|uniref:Neutral metalloproteinase n=1 Tax=Gemmata obscuriglobus TaxID=114 RepID=A0A2Z3GTY4_9BACT|nr:M4 family metallopeptidase [Gemmata obscuriglobus]AWM36728.1 M4 family peptidase [Gemmata obscuriglobus]QEG30621.1 Protease PrtS precursor [Gemmata obscuriglobus]VTS09945.1 peptidase m4 : Thermolysin metallopeptidase, alpha-helical domain protein OS=Streptomyces turgidiscabies Car8 GN=STRTUCAR8_05392 PE=4 SV=1: Peptidase_M4: Peptidase_M4_C [Gemmata obscuriglobus UQM 2246]